MSRIGRKPINIPDGVTIENQENLVTVKGKLGELQQQFHPDMVITQTDGQLLVKRPSDSKQHRELHGLTRALLANMINGVNEGFKKELQLVGVGYSADAKSGQFLILNLGYSHPIYFQIPEGIKIETPNPTTIHISGIDRQQVGQVAAKIRSLRKPEPYKGKGIRYVGEFIRRKATKTVGG